jgi:hypothetical protein
MTGFWADGAEAYEAALRQEYQAKVQELRQRQCQANTEAERLQIANELQELKAEHRAKLASLGRSLF